MYGLGDRHLGFEVSKAKQSEKVRLIKNMGQVVAFFRNLAQRCHCSSEQQETESITMETVSSTPTKALVSAMSMCTTETVSDLNLTDHGSGLTDTYVSPTDSDNMETHVDSKLMDPKDTTIKSIDMETTGSQQKCGSGLIAGSNPTDTQLSPIAVSTVDPVHIETVGDLNLTDNDVEDLFQTDPGTTDTDGDLKLSDHQVEDLAQIIVSKHMATIAIKYLGLPYETVENLKLIRQNDFVAFNRDLLVLWRNKCQGINQVQVKNKVTRILLIYSL